MWLAGAPVPLEPGWTDGPVRDREPAGLQPAVSGGRPVPRPPSRWTLSRTLSPGARLSPQPSRSLSRGPLHSTRLPAGSGDWDVVHEARPWPQLETGPPRTGCVPLCSAARPCADSAQIPRRREPPHALRSPSHPGLVTMAWKATSEEQLRLRTHGRWTGWGHGGN